MNIDAYFDEKTPDAVFAEKVAAWEALSDKQKFDVASALIDIQKEAITKFMEALKAAITRQIELVRVIPLYGSSFIAQSIEEAIIFIEGYNETLPPRSNFIRYEVEIRYITGDVIQANFQEKERVIECLRAHLPAPLLAHEHLELFDQEE